MQRGRIPIAAIPFAVYAFAQTQTGQSADRTFHFKNLSGPPQLAEIVTALRQVAGIPRYSSDEAAGTVTVRGTPEQVELASWLVDLLDVTTGKPGVHEYAKDGSVARVFYLTNLTKPQSVQELITTLRQVPQLQKLSLQESGALALEAHPNKLHWQLG
jgi:hypothetical protein